ncbi:MULTISPECIES: hypothetical protein [Streptomyces]|uniref:Secreted protein n=2 Tax=Streptomyces avermitilis TaxID=33903 RepID=Q828J4_STRAW|nr:hypothetical protein [Streptomyces avermitilis]MYT02217.1 hypothetical protein [Streptomyces sp. SID5469]KUN53772.1 hypothetical protein AQJ43_16820 [Streptomyces avermitilis]OOV27234.1 hypothetical protein SM007_20895 [Streptomyces avermitilis]BAC74386.1 putative secreted protein [Streptomyces avermitilis MA-4680 = NBRC 14893]BBJ54947.1 hypothetical protein SAVMC3_75760 [Streptomyces avermitilis]
MQQSAVPELAHTTTRPIHWVATATALAGVVALSSVLQPGSATAAQPGPGTKAAKVATAPPDPAKADFPLDCGPTKLLVQKKASGDLDGDGQPETVAVVRCDASMGTPPDGVYVLTRAADAKKPRVVATLVDPKDRLTVTDFAVRDGAVTATFLGYSSSDVPSCCPDVKDRAKWQWKGGAFVRSTPSAAQSV